MATHNTLRRRGFTLAESLVAMTIMAVTGSALLLGVSSSLQNAEAARDRTIATGIAEQMIDEVLGKVWVVPGANPLQWPLVASGYENAGPGRSRFNDTDDYHNYTAQELENIYGVALGTGNGTTAQRHVNFRLNDDYFDDWRQEFEVYYVDEDDPQTRLASGQTSYARCVEVRVSREVESGVYRNLATLRRVFAYVPPPSN